MSTIEQAVVAHRSFDYLGTQGDGQHIVACNCHNPDENGEGRSDFTGGTFEEALYVWLDHVLLSVEGVMTAESTAAEEQLLS